MDEMTDDNFMLHLMGNPPKEYEITLMDLKNCFYKTGGNELTIKVIHQKLNARYETLETKRIEVEDKKEIFAVMKNEVEEKQWQFKIGNNSKGCAGLVIDMATRLLFVQINVKVEGRLSATMTTI